MQFKLLYLSVVALLLYLLSLNKWFIACALLFLIVPFIQNVFDVFKLKQANLSIKRKVQPISEVGTTLTVSLEIINKGSYLSWVEIQDLMDESLLAQNQKNKWLLSFQKNEKKTLTYEINTKRGFHKFEGIKITNCDWFGLTQKIQIIQETSSIQVNPSLDAKDQIRLNSKRLHGFSGLINSKRAGIGVDFFGLREYNNQDSVKHIHWRASAKLDDGFLVKQNLITKNTTAMIDVDVRFKLLPKNESHRLLEYSLKVARLVSESLINDGHKVGLTVEQADGAIIIPAGSSSSQKFRINRALAGVEEFQGLGPKSLVNMPAMFLKSYSSLILISPLEQNDVKYLINLKRRGFKVICIAPNYASLIDQSDDYAQENKEHINLKRSLLIKGLLQKGIIVIDWNVSQSFSHCVDQINLYSRLLNENKYSA